MIQIDLRSILTLCCLSGMILFSDPARAQLTIHPVFDASITNNPDAATIIGTINSALHYYEANYSNNVTITIGFADMHTGLGQSSTLIENVSYRDYYNALASHATTDYDNTALLGIAPDPMGRNPVNGNLQIRATLANLRTLGFDAAPDAGANDSNIGLNLSEMNFTRTSIDANKFDLTTTVWHEVDEVLGFGSALDGLENGAPAPTGPIETMDLFRYDPSGSRSLTTNVNAQAYFAIDGVHYLQRFNQTGGADFHDWYSTEPHVPSVQDAFGTPGRYANFTPPELIGLDVIGYTPVVPAPSALFVILLGGVPGIGVFLRRRKKA